MFRSSFFDDNHRIVLGGEQEDMRNLKRARNVCKGKGVGGYFSSLSMAVCNRRARARVRNPG